MYGSEYLEVRSCKFPIGGKDVTVHICERIIGSSPHSRHKRTANHDSALLAYSVPVLGSRLEWYTVQ